MRGLKKNAPDGAHTQTFGHGDSMTELAQGGRRASKSCRRADAHLRKFFEHLRKICIFKRKNKHFFRFRHKGMDTKDLVEIVILRYDH